MQVVMRDKTISLPLGHIEIMAPFLIDCFDMHG